MSGSIGGVTVTSWNTRMQQTQQRNRVVSRFLQNGATVVEGGTDPQAFEISGVCLVADLATSATTSTSLSNLIHTQVTIVDQFGVSWLNVQVLTMRTRRSQDALGRGVVDFVASVIHGATGGAP
jgi:hypothetical protein